VDAALGRAQVPPVEVNDETHLAVEPPPVVVRVIGILPIVLVTL
jgi:hypothetical protein